MVYRLFKKRDKMKSFHLLRNLLCILSTFFLAAPAFPEVSMGMSRSEVIKELGPPSGVAKKGGTTFLFYGASSVSLKKDKVVGVDGQLDSALSELQKRKHDDAKARAEGKVMVDGKWLAQEEAAAYQAEKTRKLQAGKNIPNGVRIVRGKGAEIAVKDLLAPGQVTIVDFFADWCGPCRAISPHLEALAQKDPAVSLTKVDIVNWNTPVVKQYKISSVPNLRVYDAAGKPVGRPTSDLREIEKYIAQAKRGR